MSFDAVVSWTLSIKCGKIVWEPKKYITIDSHPYVNICAADLKLVKAVADAANAEIVWPKEKNARMTLRYTAGVMELLKIRNAQQAADMSATAIDAEPPKRLFPIFASSAKRPKRAALGDKSLRDRPDVLLLAIPAVGGVGACDAWVQRPVNAQDALFVKADRESLNSVIGFVAASGITLDSLTAKRAWGTSGVKNKWKFGDKYYTKTDEGKYMNEGGDGDEDDCGEEMEEEENEDVDFDNIEAASE